MPAKKTQLTDAERTKRIRETAREIETSNDPKTFESAFARVMQAPSPSPSERLEAYIMQFYREEPGDLGIDDLAVASTKNLEAALKDALLGFFNDANIEPVQRPHRARIIAQNGLSPMLALLVTGPETVEKI